jgi:hypothetical protein
MNDENLRTKILKEIKKIGSNWEDLAEFGLFPEMKHGDPNDCSFFERLYDLRECGIELKKIPTSIEGKLKLPDDEYIGDIHFIGFIVGKYNLLRQLPFEISKEYGGAIKKPTFESYGGKKERPLIINLDKEPSYVRSVIIDIDCPNIGHEYKYPIPENSKLGKLIYKQ